MSHDRILLLMPTNTYRASDFITAARQMGIEVVIGAERKQALADHAPGRTLALDFLDAGAATRAIVDFARRNPFSAVVAVDDETIVLAAMASAALSLPGNSVESALAARDKSRMRELLSAADVPSPRFVTIPLDASGGDRERQTREAADVIGFPCVVKPLFLAASRGVIRADDLSGLRAAVERIERLLAEPGVAARGGTAARRVLIETFVPGREVALEGLLNDGELRTLAIFDKPDPLDGPYFEETIFVTPSRLPAEALDGVRASAAAAAKALGLRSGPVHAELRVNDGGAWLIEMAARSIGGLCSRTLRFGAGVSLEELILRHASGQDTSAYDRDRRPAGVMMIPIPGTGVLAGVRGVEEAMRVRGIEDVLISIPEGQRIVPLPEGNRYLGFIFARDDSPEAVEADLREAHSRLEVTLEPG